MFFGANGFVFPAFAQEGTTVSFVEELEEKFFDILFEFNSPSLEERDAAEETLRLRFTEFEPVWKRREFLTNGEISVEARRRFERCETLWTRDSLERARHAFSGIWTFDEQDLRGHIRIAWNEPLRIVYLAPMLRTFSWSDSKGKFFWGASGAVPEIAPDFKETFIELETYTTPIEGDYAEYSGNSGRFDALVGVDLRELELCLHTDEDDVETFRTGALTLTGALAKRREQGGWTIALRLDYDEAYDAFDSHRVWFDRHDFRLIVDDDSIAPARLRERKRSRTGVDIELEYLEDVELDMAIVSEQARLACRLPRLFALLNVEL